jgi:hypothetical protein
MPPKGVPPLFGLHRKDAPCVMASPPVTRGILLCAGHLLMGNKMTNEEITRLADWLLHMQGTFKFLEHDPVIKDHITFLKRSESWIRSKYVERETGYLDGRNHTSITQGQP